MAQINDTFIINQLNWKYSLRDYCAANVRKAFGINQSLGNADAWGRYCDTTTHGAYSGCVAWFRPGNRAISTSPAGHKYGHVGVIMNISAGLATIYDGPNGYCFRVAIDKIDGVISPEKMASLGSKIVLIPAGEKRLLPENKTDNGDHPAETVAQPVVETKAEPEPVAPSTDEALAELDGLVKDEFSKAEEAIVETKPAAAAKPSGKKTGK